MASIVSFYVGREHELESTRNDTRQTLTPSEQPKELHMPNEICFNHNEHSKKQKIMESVPANSDSYSTFTDRSSGLALDTSVSASTTNGVKKGLPFEKQPPLAHEPPLHTLFPSNDLALITAFSYERHGGLVPFLATVPAEAEHISVRSFMPKAVPLVPVLYPFQPTHAFRRRYFHPSSLTTRTSPRSKKPFPTAKRGSSSAKLALW